MDHDAESRSLYAATYLGLPTATLPEGGEQGARLPAAGEAVWVLRGGGGYADPDPTFADHFARFLDTVDPAEVRAIIVESWEEPYSISADVPVGLLAENAGRLPALRSIFLGDMESEVCEISWIKQADVTPLLEAYPKLERLEVRGSDGLALRPVRHEALKMLRFESGGLPGAVVRALGECDLPALEHLELWLGEESYGWDGTLADLEGILSGARLPALRHLGLQDSEIQDEIAAAVAAAPIVARLESLSLSMGVLGDEGAEALLSGQPLTHLRSLDLSHHYMSDDMMKRLRAALPGVELDLSEQEAPDDEDGWRYIAVGE
ncbi:hypothetical protein HNP84_001690 [Thermocatellispora tengchongensis]|uniref:Leucine-rich repeat domain-containing protein n=1 Tax=Thermocatellispora tengchongensis TaxID=1073253 RepID=A0A840P408_9ACTN|nr:STM4015 family protein [Thermocatellispora tengchongensis]MBB5131977.1 hypothetical protein [Thermocatellispora tengchongensis]